MEFFLGCWHLPIFEALSDALLNFGNNLDLNVGSRMVFTGNRLVLAQYTTPMQ